MIPKFSELVFTQNAVRSDIYDLTGSRFKGFTFVRLSEPRAEFLRRQGATRVIESWDHNTKALFTGLKPIGKGYFYGDRINGRKRALLIVRIDSAQIFIYLFKSYPRKIGSVLSEFIKMKAPGNHPPEPCHEPNREPVWQVLQRYKISVTK